MVAIKQSHKLEETLDRVEAEHEYSSCYIFMHAWIVRCIELFGIKSNVLHCGFVSMDA